MAELTAEQKQEKKQELVSNITFRYYEGEAKLTQREIKALDALPKKTTNYLIVLQYKKRKMSFTWFVYGDRKPYPTLNEVMDFCTGDYNTSEYTFEEFCEFTGHFDTPVGRLDYKRVINQNKKFAKLFGADLQQCLDTDWSE